MPIKTVINSVAHYVPERVVTNNDLAKLMDTSDEWITERTGIKERRFVEQDPTPCSELALPAIKQALMKAHITAKDLDLIVASTLSPDYYFPGIGTIIQNKLSAAFIPAIDIRAQCSGLVYGLATADAFIKSNQARKVLLVCSEVQSPVLDLTNNGRQMAVLFGDGAGALVLSAEDCKELPNCQNNERGLIDSYLGSDGSGAELLYVASPGTATKGFNTQEVINSKSYCPQMNGQQVFKNAISRMQECVEIILKRNNINSENIDLLIPHQANSRINEALREKLNLPANKVFNNIHKYGNTTSATIPICMSEAESEGILKPGKLLLTVAFGAGFTWGTNLIRW